MALHGFNSSTLRLLLLLCGVWLLCLINEWEWQCEREERGANCWTLTSAHLKAIVDVLMDLRPSKMLILLLQLALLFIITREIPEGVKLDTRITLNITSRQMRRTTFVFTFQ